MPHRKVPNPPPNRPLRIVAFTRHYWSGNHAPYRGVLHSLRADKPVNEHEAINTYLADLPEGTVVEITVRPVRHVNRQRWQLIASHVYGPAKS